VVAGATALALAPLVSELRFGQTDRHPSAVWEHRSVAPRRQTKLGISFRPLQARALDLDPGLTLDLLLTCPFQLVRLAAYWNQIEGRPGQFDTAELDRYLDQVEVAGKQVILAVGAIKNFGYPEFFIPAHRLPTPLPEHELVSAQRHPELAEAASAFVHRIVERYRDRSAIVAWQVEHEAVDPLGWEHSWRLDSTLVAIEVAAVRATDPTRPILLNGFLPTSTPVSWMQRWRTSDQGDSMAVAQQLADIVGIDYYSRHAVLGAGGYALYLDGGGLPWRRQSWRRVGRWAEERGGSVMITEGQAEPWEVVTVPPTPTGAVPYSCPPERIIDNYNFCLERVADSVSLAAYLFWGAEYWVRRSALGDDSYMGAFRRILADS